MSWAHLQHLSQAEGHNLRHTESQALVKDHIEVNVDNLSTAAVQQDVVQVPVTQPQQPPDLQEYI